MEMMNWAKIIGVVEVDRLVCFHGISRTGMIKEFNASEINGRRSQRLMRSDTSEYRVLRKVLYSLQGRFLGDSLDVS